MVYTGTKIIKYLLKESGKPDEASSSYWDKEHENFSFHKGMFSGAGPIGGYRKQNPIITSAHRILQYKFLRMGRKFSKFQSIDQLAKKIVRKQNRIYDLDVLRHTLSLSFIEKHAKNIPAPNKRITCIIGDGYAIATCLSLAQKTNKVILLNLTKTLVIDIHFLNLWPGDDAFKSSVSLVLNKQDLLQCMENQNARVIIIEAKNQKLIEYCNIDLAINIASMQEMTPKIIDQYFYSLKNNNKKLIFYCCNREEKILPDGTVTKFSAYPWGDSLTIVDELCPWHLEFYNKRPPFFHTYDGTIRHRIAVFNS